MGLKVSNFLEEEEGHKLENFYTCRWTMDEEGDGNEVVFWDKKLFS